MAHSDNELADQYRAAYPEGRSGADAWGSVDDWHRSAAVSRSQDRQRPNNESAIESPSRTPKRRVHQFAYGVAMGCTALVLLIDSIRFVSYPLLGLLAIVAGALGLSEVGRRLLQRAVIALGCVTALIVFTPLVDWCVEVLDVSQPPPQTADAIVVLGAGIHCSTGQLDAASLARLTTAITLWRSGVAPLIAISDSSAVTRPAGCPSQANVQRALITSLAGTGGPETIVLPAMRTTATEADAVANVQGLRGWTRVVVVTSPTHTRRARDIFEHAGVHAVVVAATEPQYDRSFSRPTHRIRALGLVVREVAGTVKAKLG